MDAFFNAANLIILGLLLLALVIVPPLILLASIVALFKARKSNLQGKGKATFGIIWRAILILAFIFLIVLVVNGTNTNDAKKDAQPLIAQIQKAGGEKLCENGDGGHGFDNFTPWYEVYYEIPISSQLTAEVKADAAQLGYPLAENTELINRLKGSIDKNAFSPKSDYLISSKNRGTLTVTINRETSVPLYCMNDYGKEKATGNDKAILDVELLL